MNKELESMRIFLRAIRAICKNQRTCDECIFIDKCRECNFCPAGWDNIDELKSEVTE